jgi:type VI secretion system protein ImpC
MAEKQTAKAAVAAAVESAQPTDFTRLLQEKGAWAGEGARREVEEGVLTLAKYALENTALVSDDVVSTVSAIIAEIDKKLSQQMNLILHHEDFQKLEGSWRGLKYLVDSTETGTRLKIKVMSISKNEIGKTLRKFPGTNWDQSPIFKKIYEEGYGVLGGEPYGALVGDYAFDHSPQDVELLGNISKIAAAAHAPFFASAAPSLFGFKSWSELSNPRDLAKIFTTPDYAGWRSLRESEDARYVGITMPRMLARVPYGARSTPVEEFDFEEETAGADSSKFTWANSAYAMAANINKAFALYGWCTKIRGVESGGAVTDLPLHTFPSDDGGVDQKCPTEIAITDRRSAELDNCGLLPLTHRVNSDVAVFIGGQSLQKPQEYMDPDATSNAALAARLPYMFACSRFAHYLKCIVRDKIGSFKERASLEEWLRDWINNYVDGDSANSTDAVKAMKPLAGAEVEVKDIEGRPGFYNAAFRLRPHYQLEGLTVSLRLTSRLGPPS